MKKVARLRIAADDTAGGSAEQMGVRTTGRIKKPKAVFDPSDNYLPRSLQRAAAANSAAAQHPVTETSPTASQDGKRDSERSLQLSPVAPSPPEPTCSVCNKRETKRGLGAKNKFVACIKCDVKVHKMCLKVEFEDFNDLRSKFKCDSCRSCTLCSAFSEADDSNKSELITCTKCVKSYHLTCHIPNIHKYQQFSNNWKCNKCTLPIKSNGSFLEKQAIREIIGEEVDSSMVSQSKHTSTEKTRKLGVTATAEEAKDSGTKRNFETTKSAQIDTLNGGTDGEDDDTRGGNDTDVDMKLTRKKPKRKDSSPLEQSSSSELLELPDVKCWTVDQVTEFFKKYFPNEAYVFKEHEIDGMSLLLLKRSDIIKKLPIKLGPSLRIYSLILKIQTQLNDPTLGWN